MKIGINASFLRKPGTGIGQVTASVLRTLAQSTVNNKQSTDCEFVLYCEEVPKLDFPLPEHFEVKAFLPQWWKRDDVPRKWLWERELAERALADGCDVFLSLYQSATDFRSAIKHVMVVHDIIPKLFPEYLGKISQRMHWRAIERGVLSADHIVAVSEATKHDLIGKMGIDETIITVAYPDAGPWFSGIVTPEAEQEVLEKYGLERGYIYHGGGLEVRKNAEKLLRAYAKLVKSPSTSLRAEMPMLVISGKVHAKSNRLATDVEGLVAELGLEDRVKLLGFVPDEDLPALYKGAVFFAYSSLYEGFGLPALEAMRMGTPVLTSDTSSLPEVCGEAALYCDPENIDSIASGMERLLTDVSLRETLMARCEAQTARFSWERFTQTLLDTLL